MIKKFIQKIFSKKKKWEFSPNNQIWLEDIGNWIKKSDELLEDTLKQRTDAIAYLIGRAISFHGILAYVISNFHDGEMIIDKKKLESCVYSVGFDYGEDYVKVIVNNEEINNEQD